MKTAQKQWPVFFSLHGFCTLAIISGFFSMQGIYLHNYQLVALLK